MKVEVSANRIAILDLSAIGIRYDDCCWELRRPLAAESYERISLDFDKYPCGWISAAKQHFGKTILGLTARPTQVAVTLRERFYVLRSFAAWCHEQGASSPDKVDGELVEFWGRTVAGMHQGTRVTARTEAFRATNVEHFLRDQPNCSSEVRAACSAVARRARKRISLDKRGSRTQPLCEETMLGILKDALIVVLEDAPKVISLLRQYAGPRATRHERRERRHWHSEWVGDRPSFHSQALQRLGTTIPYSEEGLIRVVNGAAIIAIALLSVMRTSELQRLCVGCVERDGDGDFANWIIKGTLAKSMRPHTWVVVPEVVAAVQVIESLGDEARKQSGTRALLAARAVSRRPYISAQDGSTSKIANAAMLVNIIRDFASLSRPDHKDKLKHLTFRVTRRFFARFIARRDRSSLGALAVQYGHLDAQITDNYYVGSDPELARLLDEESTLEVIRAMEDLATSTSLYTKLPETLVEETRERLQATLARASSHREVLRMLGGGIVLGPCDWGYCFYHKSRSRCQGNEDGPNLANRAPSVCASCLNFSATSRHAEWWQRRVKDSEEFLKLRGTPEQARAIASERLNEARKILHAIGDRK